MHIFSHWMFFFQVKWFANGCFKWHVCNLGISVCKASSQTLFRVCISQSCSRSHQRRGEPPVCCVMKGFGGAAGVWYGSIQEGLCVCVCAWAELVLKHLNRSFCCDGHLPISLDSLYPSVSECFCSSRDCALLSWRAVLFTTARSCPLSDYCILDVLTSRVRNLPFFFFFCGSLAMIFFVCVCAFKHQKQILLCIQFESL